MVKAKTKASKAVREAASSFVFAENKSFIFALSCLECKLARFIFVFFYWVEISVFLSCVILLNQTLTRSYLAIFKLGDVIKLASFQLLGEFILI